MKFLGKTDERKARRKGREEKKRQQREGIVRKRRKTTSDTGKRVCQFGSGCCCRNGRACSLLHTLLEFCQGPSWCSLSPCLTLGKGEGGCLALPSPCPCSVHTTGLGGCCRNEVLAF